MDTVVAGMIEIWPTRGRERVALGMGAIFQDNRYWMDPKRQDDKAATLKKMFGTDAAKRLREAALAAESPLHPVNQAPASAPEAAAELKLAQVSDIVYSRTTQFVWTDAAVEIGATPGAVFVAKRAMIDHDGNKGISYLRIVAGAPGASDDDTKEFLIQAENRVGWKPSPLDIQAALEPNVARFVRHAAAEQIIEAAPAQNEPEHQADAGNALMDSLIAKAGGAKGPSVEWLGESLDRPQTGASTGMRATVTSASFSQGPAGSRVLKMVLDYRAFSAHNTALAPAGKTSMSFETIELVATAAEGEGLSALTSKVVHNFKAIGAPEREVGPDHVSAAEQRKTDDRIQLAEAANAEVVRAGGTPPAPLPPVNTSSNASRVYFWSAREKDSDYSYLKVIDALKAADLPFLTDRDRGTKYFGLRYIEATQAQVAQLPDSLKFFLTEEAHQAHLLSKHGRAVSDATMADAAATAAVEVIAKREEQAKAPVEPKADASPVAKPEPVAPKTTLKVAPKAAQKSDAKVDAAPAPAANQNVAQPAAPQQPDVAAEQPAAPEAPKASKLRPIAVPHPEHDRDGWVKARNALYNIEPGKLADLMDLTWKMHRELELKEDIAATIGEFFSKDDARRLATWSHGLRLGEKVLEKKGIKWVSPEERDNAQRPQAEPAKAETNTTTQAKPAQRRAYPAREG